MADTSIIDASFQIIKIFAYIITFSLVLGGAVLAKSIVLLMTSQLAPNRMVSVQMGSLLLGLKLPLEEKYLWIWAIFVSLLIPEIGTFFRSVRIAIFKGYVDVDEPLENDEIKREPISVKYIIIVTTVMETLHAFGLALFVFGVLPYIDVAKGVMLTNCVCVVPGFLSKYKL